MNILQEKIDSLNSVLKVQIKPEDYAVKVNDALKKYSKKVTMPGFRPGMVPLNMVRKMYGKSLLADELNKLVSDSVDQYISENNLQILGNPLPKETNDLDINWDAPADFEFSFEMGLAPEVNFALPPAHSFEYFDISVDEKSVEEEVTKIIRRYGEYITPDVMDNECSAYGTFQEVDANGEIVEGGHTNQSFLLLDKINDAAIRQQFVGKVALDTVTFNPSAAIKSVEEVKYMLSLKPDESVDPSKTYRFTIERINKVKPAELNKELFDRLYGAGVVTDENAFREKIRAEIAEGYRYESEHAVQHELEDVLLKDANLNLPDEFLKRWLKHTNEKITDEQLAAEYSKYSRDLKWKLIENKIFKEQNMEITNEELEAFARNFIVDQYVRYGQAHMLTEDTLTDMTKKYLQNKESLQRVIESLSGRKVFEYLNQIINKNVKRVSHEEFVDLMSKHQHDHH